MIPFKQLEDMFTNMRTDTKWNVDGILLWGYFFTDSNLGKLEKAAEYLVQCGYHFARTYKTDDGHTYVLRVEKAEKHTPQTLYARNGEFERLAHEFCLESYDGMDVGTLSLLG
jgi:hypothetical protein